MIRIVFFLLFVAIIIFKLHRINKKVLCTKAFIFISEIKKKTPLEEANYKANLFDFFKKKEVKAAFEEAKIILKEDYNGNMDKLIYRAKTWGFVDTHTKAMFSKKNQVIKLLEHNLIIQSPEVFSGNASETSKAIVNKFWDVNSFFMHDIGKKACVLKILLEQYNEEKNEHCIFVASQIAVSLKDDLQYLNEKDLAIMSEWNEIVKKRNKKK